ncbi:MAG: flagellar hook-associated protein FlgL [Clostridiales bacterium]|nr:flagellar hook-associated protein FlgL [Clostridiales bacterium]
MRITNNMLISNMMTYMSDNISTLAKYQTMISTKKLIQKASEDPIIASRSLKLKTDVSVLSQYSKNADSAGAWMETTETAIRSVSSILLQIREKAEQASNGTLTDDDRRSIASEIKQMRDELINLANSTYSGRYIFSGYKSDTPLLDANGFLNTVVSQLEKINYEVGVTNKIQVNVTGDSLFNLDSPVSYLPARSALIQDIDDFLALIDARASVTSSAPLDLIGPGAYDMSGVSVDIDVGTGGTPVSVTVNFDGAAAKNINRMTTDEILDHINKKLGTAATASLDKNGALIIRSLSGAGVTVSDSAGAPGSAARLLGGDPLAVTSASTAGAALTGTKSLTQPTVDVSAYAPFEIYVDRGALPITIDLSGAPGTLIADEKNARLDEIAAEINRQIANQVLPSLSTPDPLKWAKCTVEDGRLCITSESFGDSSYISLSQQQEVFSLFGVTPSVKQGNTEQQGKLVGSRDFREPVYDVTAFRSASGEAPTVKVTINGTHIAQIKLDDGDPAIDPHNMTLRQMMKKIDDSLMGYASCDIDDGRLVIRSAQGGSDSSLEISSLDESFLGYLFGEDPIVKNGANDPTHGYYKSGVAYKPADSVSLGGPLTMGITVNAGSASPIGPITVTVPDGLTPAEIVDQINSQLAAADPTLAQAMLPDGDSSFSFAVLVDAQGKQAYPPLPDGSAALDGEQGYYLSIRSHTWGAGSGIKVDSGDATAMAALFGKGTASAPSKMAGADGFVDEICKWLDVADAQLDNVNRVWTDLGARMKRVELTQARLEMDGLVSVTLLSQNEDTDIAQASMLLEMAELVYNASLSVGARVIQTTLMDFLR